MVIMKTKPGVPITFIVIDSPIPSTLQSKLVLKTFQKNELLLVAAGFQF